MNRIGAAGKLFDNSDGKMGTDKSSEADGQETTETKQNLIERIEIARDCFMNSLVKLGLDQNDETHTFLDFGILQALLCVRLQMVRHILEGSLDSEAEVESKIKWEKIEPEDIFCGLIKLIKNLADQQPLSEKKIPVELV